eukprot:Em0002g1145a
MAETIHAVLDRARIYWASDSRKSIISFRSPLEIWAENPTFLLVEVTFLVWVTLTMKHDPCFYYTAYVAVSRLKLSVLLEPFALAICVVLLDVPYDILGVKLLWWTWHDTDPNLYDRTYYVPWTSYMFHLTFASTSSSSLTPPERCSRAETAVGRREKGALLEAGCASFVGVVLAGCLSMPLAVLGQMLPAYNFPHDVYGIHTEVLLWTLLGTYFFWLLQCLVTLGVVGRMVEQEGGAEIPNPRVLAQTKTNRPLVSPDTYSGDRNWTDWVEHFEAAALVNGWDEPTKLLWLPVRLTGKAQTAWRRLAPEAKQDFQAAKDALQKRFEPESKRQLYVVEFQTRKRRPDEQWSDFGDELRILADKAFPGIDEKAKDLLSLERYLSELDNPKVAFAVRQRQPKTLDDAVSCTMEMESYLHQETKGSKISVVSDVPVEERETLMAMIHSLSERMGKLETSERPAQARAGRRKPETYNSSREPAASKDTIICLKCGKEGHFARGCAAGWQKRKQEN